VPGDALRADPGGALHYGAGRARHLLLRVRLGRVQGRGLHSSSFQLNVSASCGIEGASMGYSDGDYGVLGGIRGCFGCIVCQKRLRLS